MTVHRIDLTTKHCEKRDRKNMYPWPRAQLMYTVLWLGPGAQGNRHGRRAAAARARRRGATDR